MDDLELDDPEDPELDALCIGVYTGDTGMGGEWGGELRGRGGGGGRDNSSNESEGGRFHLEGVEAEGGLSILQEA